MKAEERRADGLRACSTFLIPPSTHKTVRAEVMNEADDRRPSIGGRRCAESVVASQKPTQITLITQIVADHSVWP